MVLGFVLITGTAVVALLVGEHRKASWVRAAKLLASTGFVGVALASDAAESGYGRLVFLALVLSWLGDLLLTYRAPTAFLSGLVAFLLAHVGYGAAFMVRGIRWGLAAGVATVIAIVAVAVWRWLQPHLSERMGKPVAAYVVVISAMVALAVGTAASDPGPGVLIGALAFYLSDLAVARNRFVSPGFINRLWGLPLYYLAQVLLALSTAMV